VWCSVLRYVAVCCSVVSCVVVWVLMLMLVRPSSPPVCCSVLQCVSSVLQCGVLDADVSQAQFQQGHRTLAQTHTHATTHTHTPTHFCAHSLSLAILSYTRGLVFVTSLTQPLLGHSFSLSPTLFLSLTNTLSRSCSLALSYTHSPTLSLSHTLTLPLSRSLARSLSLSISLVVSHTQED